MNIITRLLKNSYYLISHNSDDSISENDLKYIDDKILHWFAMKLNVKSNDKISPLPSGLENARFRVNGKVKNYQLIINKNKNIYNHKQKKYFVHSMKIQTLRKGFLYYKLLKSIQK